jgi:hypothetical protein
MDFDAAIACSFILLFLFFWCAFYFQRLRWKRNKRLGKKHLGFCPTFSSLGNAFQRVHQLAQPQVEISLQEEQAAEDAEDEEELVENGIEHLHRQLKKIKNGDEIDRLTVLLHWWRS